MRAALALALAVAVGGCASRAPALTAPSAGPVTVPTSVPNGRVDVTVAASYPQGQPVRATIRLIPKEGTLAGPLEPYVQASGFNATATVRRLAATPITATSAGGAIELDWDGRSDEGTLVEPDDYSLVFTVRDDRGRTTRVGVTLIVRAP